MPVTADDQRLAERLAASEARFRNVITRNADGMIVLDAYGVVRFANPAAGELLGRSVDELIGMDLGYPAVAGEATEIDVVRSDGQVVSAEMRTVETEWEGQPALLASLRDLTELKARADDLERTNRRLEEFAYVVSHDLRAPLTTIDSALQLLVDELGPAGGHIPEYVDMIRRNVDRMDRLIVDLLTYSRAGRGGDFESVDLGEVVADALAALDGEITQTGAVVEIGPLPVVVGDRGQLVQLFQNLVANAIKYVAPGTVPRLKVSALRMRRGWEIRAADNGIGVPPAKAEEIFHMFVRLRSDQYEGTGIGLAICERIVERHGGRIWCRPGPDGGSEFVFTLPDRS